MYGYQIGQIENRWDEGPGIGVRCGGEVRSLPSME
jgi:hypothetical protein